MRSLVYIAFKIIAIAIVAFLIIMALSSILPAIGDFIEKIRHLLSSIAESVKNLASDISASKP